MHFCGPSFNVRLPSTSDKATAGSLHAESLFKLFLAFFFSFSSPGPLAAAPLSSLSVKDL